MNRVLAAAAIVVGALVLSGCFASLDSAIEQSRDQPGEGAEFDADAPEEQQSATATTAVDEFADYYDDVPPPAASEGPGAFNPDIDAELGPSMMWGGFGAPGAIEPVHWIDQSQPASDLRITVECVGPTILDLRTAPRDQPVDDAAPAAVSVLCPASTTLDLRTLGEGFSLSLDSHGSTGAYRVTVAPEI